MAHGKREGIHHMVLWQLCPQSQERPWTVKLCLKNADSVFDGEGKRDLQNFMSGGKAINMNARQILKGPQDQWMLLEFWIFFKGLLRATVCSTWSSSGMETAKHTSFWHNKLSMEMSVLKSLNVWATYRSVWVHACVPGKAIRKNTQHNGYAECSDGHLASQQIYQWKSRPRIMPGRRKLLVWIPKWYRQGNIRLCPQRVHSTGSSKCYPSNIWRLLVRRVSKCMHGGTQNQNKTINGMIWQRATKETHSSLPTVETATF